MSEARAGLARVTPKGYDGLAAWVLGGYTIAQVVVSIDPPSI